MSFDSGLINEARVLLINYGATFENYAPVIDKSKPVKWKKLDKMALLLLANSLVSLVVAVSGFVSRQNRFAILGCGGLFLSYLIKNMLGGMWITKVTSNKEVDAINQILRKLLQVLPKHQGMKDSVTVDHVLAKAIEEKNAEINRLNNNIRIYLDQNHKKTEKIDEQRERIRLLESALPDLYIQESGSESISALQKSQPINIRQTAGNGYSGSSANSESSSVTNESNIPEEEGTDEMPEFERGVENVLTEQEQKLIQVHEDNLARSTDLGDGKLEDVLAHAEALNTDPALKAAYDTLGKKGE